MPLKFETVDWLVLSTRWHLKAMRPADVVAQRTPLSDPEDGGMMD
jgi:hypothetical protein